MSSIGGTPDLKKPVSKAQVRAELEAETERFLEQGGRVKDIPRGVSGKEPGAQPTFPHRPLFIEPRAPRTEIPEVLAALDARRKLPRGRTAQPKRSRLPQPRRKVIYDDFGEPLRRVWIEEK